MSFFRKRIDNDLINSINEEIFLEVIKKIKENEGFNEKEKAVDICSVYEAKNENYGNSILVATVAPRDIKYPTDVNRLNKSRETLEKIVGKLHAPDIGKKEYREHIKKRHEEIILPLKRNDVNKKNQLE